MPSFGGYVNANTIYTCFKVCSFHSSRIPAPGLTSGQYVAGAGLLGSTIAATALYVFQCRLIYPSYVPEGSRKIVPTPKQVGLPYEDVTLTTSDGVEIKGYVIPARRNQVSTETLKELKRAEQQAIAEKEVADWTKEMETDEAIDVSRVLWRGGMLTLV